MDINEIYLKLSDDVNLFKNNEIKLEYFLDRLNLLNNSSISDELMEELIAFNSFLGCKEKALKNISLLKEGAPCIITGHQPSLLTGPLFTIYKGISAIKYGKILEEKLKRPVIPIFWIAGNDHDLHEVNKINLINNKNNIEEFSLDLPWTKEYLSKIHFEKQWQYFLEKIKQWEGNANNILYQEINKIVNGPEITFTIQFGKLMTKLFSDYGMIFFDISQSCINEKIADIYKKTLIQWDDIIIKVNSGGINLKGKNLHPPLVYDSKTPLLFIEEDGKRQQLYKSSDLTFYTKKRSYKLKDLLNNVNKLTPNVALRPIVQDSIFPTLAYIGGPSELLYLYQIKDLYSIYNLSPPVFLPRISATIIEKPIERYIEKESFDINKIKEDPKGYIEVLLKNSEIEKIENQIIELQSNIKEKYRDLKSLMETIDPQLIQMADKNFVMISNNMNFLMGRIKRSWENRNNILLRRFKSTANNLYPKNQPQERILNIFQYINKYSFDFIHYLMNNLVLVPNHQYIYIRGEEDEN